MKKSIRILIVEDDKNAGFLLKENLKLSGFDVLLVKDGTEGVKVFDKEWFDLCILDIMLPSMDGFQLAKNIRKKNEDIPIIFLTARDLDEDKLQGFKLGCDDYLTKPYNIEELLLRINAILRRTIKNEKHEGDSYSRAANIELFYDARILKTKQCKYKLSTKEADLIKLFFDHQQVILSRSAIMKEVWGKDDYFVSKSLDVYLTKIRKYLKNDNNIEIQNIHGYGYRLIIRKSQI